ncbi:ATPase family protein [Tolypocladium capitatum]|uniref:ATPase family protein n=1 Tax=Tolypocladium capitatum TaxID=45235 RepID=A0A2K3QBK9_9HYPO|nr:ATPase family protein [Tolypocladium capitatum]
MHAMVKKSIDAKVRPLPAGSTLEKASLAGAGRLYVSKESLLGLTNNSLESGRLCVLERLEGDPLRREATLWVQPAKDLSPNVVVMTRAFQEATGFKIGDYVRIVLREAVPDADDVVAQHVTKEDETPWPDEKRAPGWASAWNISLGLSLDRAEQVFPGMVFEGVQLGKLRRTFKIVSVNSQTDNLARFRITSTTVRQPEEAEDATAAAAPGGGGALVVTGVPGLGSAVKALNQFLRGFGRPFWVKNERLTCALVIHGGPGTGKTFILRRIEETRWGRTYWINPSDKLSAMREAFKQARASQPSLVFIDGLDEMTGKDRSNRESVIGALAEELDGLSAEAIANDALPNVVVIATCLDYITDVPAKLQDPSRFPEEIALPIPRAAERLDILTFLNPHMRPEDKEQCLRSLSQKTHAYSGRDLSNLVQKANRVFANRLDDEGADWASGLERFLTPGDMEQALRVTRPTAMHDINLRPPTVHWQDVGGQESVKKALSRMIKNAKDPNLASSRVLRHRPKGMLLYGPPGCSKTLSAQAMATESGFNFFAVKGAEMLNMYVGESERAVRTLFARAKAASPSIIFFDEIESIGGQRGPGPTPGGAVSRSTGAVNMLTTLLTELDGFEALTGVLVLGATNRPEAIDPALLRPGRFDKVLYVGPPDRPAREAIFGVHLRGLDVSPAVDVAELARLADGYSGAEIQAICTEAGQAVEDRFQDDDTGTAKLEICMEDLVAAMENTQRNITRGMIESYEEWRGQFKKL